MLELKEERAKEVYTYMRRNMLNFTLWMDLQ